MVSLLAKDPHQNPHRETNKTVSIPNELENAQKLKSPTGVKQPDYIQVVQTTGNSDTLQLLDSYQKMKAEEQRLIELKQQILTRQQDLQNTLLKEIEKMKATIANLNSEIPELENKTQKLGEALGIDN